MKKIIALTVICIFSLTACKDNVDTDSTANKPNTKTYVKDYHSYAEPNKAVIKHLSLNIDVDFDNKIISGTATYNIDNNNSETIVLDSKFLDIKNVTADGKPTSFSLGNFDEYLGQPLIINISKDTKTIVVEYNTTDKTEALQWLNPQQTADKKYPFLFTQGQAILTRTWIPIQDSPQIRITYDAKVKVPSELMAVMSAKNPTEKSQNGQYSFSMEQPIPPYLMALAVGDIQYKAISNRTGIYAEPSIIYKAHEEFSDMEKMVSAAENLYGKYAWEQFDVIVLPPSFPFGGMENPRLTFATPTVIAGDKSLTSLIAHELAHSWSGNLVTNSTWNDFWLNEGFTVYFEIRIMEALYGKERAEMIALIGRQDLDDELENLKNTPELTKLKLDLKGKNPDDGMSSIAYDKGYLFLRTLEEAVGRDKFDAFLKDYFKQHAFTTVTTEMFVEYLNKNLLEKNNIDFNVDEWIYQPGIPENQAQIVSDKFNNAEMVLNKFLSNNAVDKSQTNDWTTQEWVHFIRNFPESITPEQMAMLDDAFDFSHVTNSHIAMVWYEQSIKHNYHGNDVDNQIKKFLISVGRRWYVSTLFKAYKTANRTDEAIEIYKQARPNYHAVTANTIDNMLGYKE